MLPLIQISSCFFIILTHVMTDFLFNISIDQNYHHDHFVGVIVQELSLNKKALSMTIVNDCHCMAIIFRQQLSLDKVVFEQ